MTIDYPGQVHEAGIPKVYWCGSCNEWHESGSHVIESLIRERILDFKALWFGIEPIR